MEWVNKRIEDAKNQAVDAETFDKKEYFRGQRDAHRQFLKQIELMLQGKK